MQSALLMLSNKEKKDLKVFSNIYIQTEYYIGPFDDTLRSLHQSNQKFNYGFLCCLNSRNDRKAYLKRQKFRWTNIFTIKMFIFANFIQKINFG